MILTYWNELEQTLTDFKGGNEVFEKIFQINRELGAPIKTILELGVYRIKEEPKSDYPGQSLKTLLILGNFYKDVEKHISLDIDDCKSTVERCKKWVKKQGLKVHNHKFVQENSVKFNVEKEFPKGIDFIFLDTNHDDTYPEKIGYENSGGAGMTYREICYYAPHITENGHLFMHDTKNYYAERKYGYNTEGAIQKFLDENEGFVFVEHNPNENGLGELIRKDSSLHQKYISLGLI